MPIPRALHEELSLSSFFKKLVAEVLDVARAELDLARAEAAGVAKLYVTGGVICLACFVVATATAVILGQAAALALQPYFSGPAMAYLITGLAMFLLTILLAWLGVNFITRKYQPVGTIFKWLTGQHKTS